MLEIAAAVLLLASGASTVAIARRARAHARWRRIFEEAAAHLGGRAATGGVLTGPELRAEVDGILVTVKLEDVHVPHRGRARAEAQLPEEPAAQALRLFVGWDVDATPIGLEHFPELAVPAPALEGHVLVRGNDAATAGRFIALAGLDLTDIRREAFARALMVTARGGHLDLTLLGFEETTALVERLAGAGARLTHHLVAALAGQGTVAGGRSPGVEVDPPLPCTLCSAKTAGIWVSCAKCLSPYHRACFAQAGGCVAKACGETRSVPFSPRGHSA